MAPALTPGVHLTPLVAHESYNHQCRHIVIGVSDSFWFISEDKASLYIWDNRGKWGIEWGTESKALDISKNTTHTSWPWFRAWNQSSTTLNKADTVDRLAINFHCCKEIGAWFYRKSSRTILTWRSMSLLTIGRTDIGLYPEGCESSFPCEIGRVSNQWENYQWILKDWTEQKV